jgi:hypothetical protein
MRALMVALLVLAAWSHAGLAHAHIERFAVIVGNDRGLPGELALHYAEDDARKVADVLAELGGFQPANTVLLAGQSADTLRRTLITVNDRVRSAISQPDTDVVLFVYYSGHADADALHLGDSRFQTAELAQLVRGSAASFRLLVVDACRSGQLTRKKGGTVGAPFPLEQGTQLAGEGLAFLTASSADEDDQESDALRGSFFTHALVSGLLGAADADSDGAVVLEEAYRYAYDATLRATSRTAYGTQHPTFQYDLRGQGQLVLTETQHARARRGTLGVGPGLDMLVFRGSADGAVVAEVTPGSHARSLNLAEGRYFIRVRAESHLLEGVVTVRAGASTQVDTGALTHIEYARLVRKGGHGQKIAHGLELGGRVRTALPNAETPCFGGLLGYRVDRERVSLGARAGYCESRFTSRTLEARVRELDLVLRMGHAWDVRALTLELGAGAGAALFWQTFEGQGRAPARTTLTGHASAFAAASYVIGRGLYAGLDLEGQLYVLRLRERHDELRAAFSARAALVVGKQF